MAKQMPYKRMSEYQPRLPSNNAYDYYISAARKLKVPVVYTGNQPPTREEVRWIEVNQGAFTILQQGYTRAYWLPFREIGFDFCFDEFAKLRHLARLVNTRIRWAIATKDGMDAVHDWHIGFKMARDIQGDLLLPYIDPFSGRPFIYRLMDERYQLYSVGEDGKDDGGHNPNKKENPDAEAPRDLFLTRDSWR